MDQSFQPFDWQRIIVGDAELVFLLEIVMRTFLLYAFALAMLRWMGKRGMAQLTPFEFAIIVALGSAVGDPMFYPDVPLLHGFVVVTTVVLMQRGVSEITSRSERASEIASGSPTIAVRRGEIMHEVIERDNFTVAEVLELLRLAGVARLAEVELAVIEDSGKLSILTTERAQDGTSNEIWDVVEK